MIRFNRHRIRNTLQQTKTSIFAQSELSQLLRQNATGWMVGDGESIPRQSALTAKSPSINDLTEALVKGKILKKAVLPFPYRQDVRYLFGDVDLFALVQSLHRDGYFTHLSAMYLNDLTEQIPKTIYFNIEQRGSGGAGHLTQEALDRAFKAEPRLSSNVVEFEATRIVKVNGRNTGQLGVVLTRVAGAQAVRVTDLERTLIDATVRPVYSGGIAVVARAFEMAREAVSVNKLTAYLRRLRYVYPYHQAIGFYMERAGYEEPLLSLLEDFPVEHNFYLQHGMKSRVLNKRWRLYVPKGF